MMDVSQSEQVVQNEQLDRPGVVQSIRWPARYIKPQDHSSVDPVQGASPQALHQGTAH